MKHKNLAQVLTCVFLAVLLLCTQALAYAMEVPVSQTEHEIDGKQTLVKVYEVAPSVDPNSLIEPDFEQNGFIYHMTSIVKDAITIEDEIEVTQEYEIVVPISSEAGAKEEAFASMPPYIEYEQDGYKGKLYPVPNSLSGQITGRSSHSQRKTKTKTYTFDYNDDSLVPTSLDGYALSSISWSDGACLDGTSIPSSYTATATYSKNSSYSTVDGWLFTISYSGNAEYESEDAIRYTLTYTGTIPEPEPESEPEPEPTFWEWLFGKRDSSGVQDGENAPDINPIKTSGRLSATKVILGGICLLAALTAAGLCVFIVVKVLKDNRVEIYGRDEMSGEFRPLKTVWFNMKNSGVCIDPLEFPAIQRFRVVLKPGLAERMKGKVLTIKVGQQIYKQTIGAAAGTDYVTEVNLDPASF